MLLLWTTWSQTTGFLILRLFQHWNFRIKIDYHCDPGLFPISFNAKSSFSTISRWRDAAWRSSMWSVSCFRLRLLDHVAFSSVMDHLRGSLLGAMWRVLKVEKRGAESVVRASEHYAGTCMSTRPAKDKHRDLDIFLLCSVLSTR